MSDSGEMLHTLRELATSCRLIAEHIDAGPSLAEPELRRSLEEFHGALGALLRVPPSGATMLTSESGIPLQLKVLGAQHIPPNPYREGKFRLVIDLAGSPCEVFVSKETFEAYPEGTLLGLVKVGP